MTIKELAMIRSALCMQNSECSKCLLGELNNCGHIDFLAQFLTPAKEQKLADWYHNNANTYINNFCKRFPNADREYVVNNICCDMIYKGHECNDCEGTVDGCVAHWNSVIDCE